MPTGIGSCYLENEFLLSENDLWKTDWFKEMKEAGVFVVVAVFCLFVCLLFFVLLW